MLFGSMRGVAACGRLITTVLSSATLPESLTPRCACCACSVDLGTGDMALQMVDESIATLWGSSGGAAEEFPASPDIVRTAVALGRQMLDPLALLGSLCGEGGALLLCGALAVGEGPWGEWWGVGGVERNRARGAGPLMSRQFGMQSSDRFYVCSHTNSPPAAQAPAGRCCPSSCTPSRRSWRRRSGWRWWTAYSPLRSPRCGGLGTRCSLCSLR